MAPLVVLTILMFLGRLRTVLVHLTPLPLLMRMREPLIGLVLALLTSPLLMTVHPADTAFFHGLTQRVRLRRAKVL